MEIKYILALYVTGNTRNSITAIDNLTNILEEEMPGLYELRVIDIKKNPEIVEKEKIFVTPTLAMVFPPGARKIIGDLGDKEKVLAWLKIEVLKE